MENNIRHCPFKVTKRRKDEGVIWVGWIWGSIRRRNRRSCKVVNGVYCWETMSCTSLPMTIPHYVFPLHFACIYSFWHFGFAKNYSSGEFSDGSFSLSVLCYPPYFSHCFIISATSYPIPWELHLVACCYYSCYRPCFVWLDLLLSDTFCEPFFSLTVCLFGIVCGSLKHSTMCCVCIVGVSEGFDELVTRGGIEGLMEWRRIGGCGISNHVAELLVFFVLDVISWTWCDAVNV